MNFHKTLPVFLVLITVILLFALGLSFQFTPSTAAQEASPTPDATAQAAADNLTELWEDATATTIGTTAEWTNKLELADINGDGMVDMLFANGGNYDSPGVPVASRVFLCSGSELVRQLEMLK